MPCCLPQPIVDEAVPANARTRPTARIPSSAQVSHAAPIMRHAECAAPGAFGPPAQGGEPFLRLSEGLQGIEQTLDEPHQRAEAGRLVRIVEELLRSVERDGEPVRACRPLVLELRAPPRGHEVPRPGQPRDELRQRILQGPSGEPGSGDDLGESRLRRFDLVEDVVERSERRDELVRQRLPAEHHAPKARRRAARIRPGSFVATASTPARISSTASSGSSQIQVPTRMPDACTRSANPSGAPSSAPIDRQHPGMPLGTREREAASASTLRSVEQTRRKVRRQLTATRDGEGVEARDEHRAVEPGGRDRRYRRLDRLLAIGFEVRLTGEVLDLDVGGGATGQRASVSSSVGHRPHRCRRVRSGDGRPARGSSTDQPSPVRRARDVGIVHDHRTPSDVIRTSNSTASAPSSIADSNASTVFSATCCGVTSVRDHRRLTERPFRHYRSLLRG